MIEVTSWLVYVFSGESEVSEFQKAVSIHQHVFRFKISVNDLIAVKISEG